MYYFCDDFFKIFVALYNHVVINTMFLQQCLELLEFFWSFLTLPKALPGSVVDLSQKTQKKQTLFHYLSKTIHIYISNLLIMRITSLTSGLLLLLSCFTFAFSEQFLSVDPKIVELVNNNKSSTWFAKRYDGMVFPPSRAIPIPDNNNYKSRTNKKLNFLNNLQTSIPTSYDSEAAHPGCVYAARQQGSLTTFHLIKHQNTNHFFQI